VWGMPAPPPPPPPGWSPPPTWGAPSPWAPGPWAAALPPRPKAGNARTGPLPLHPMTVGDILDGSFKLLKANARTVLTITAVFVAPLQVLAAFLQRDVLGGQSIFDVMSDPSVADQTQSSNAQTVASLVAALVTILVQPFVAGAISRVVAASYLGGDLAPGSALRVVGRRWWALIGSWFLVHLLEGLGILVALVLLLIGALAGGSAALLLLIPLLPVAALSALIFMALFVAVAPAIAVEELGPVQGMRRSWRLMRPRVFPVLGTALLTSLVVNLIGSALGFVPQVIALAIGTGGFGWVLLAVGGILSSLVTTPLVAIVSTLLYFDARIRHEGFDLQVMARDVSTVPADR
jgi:hypothetical protein